MTRLTHGVAENSLSLSVCLHFMNPFAILLNKINNNMLIFFPITQNAIIYELCIEMVLEAVK